MESEHGPDAPFVQLELLVRNLGHELAAFRKRAQAAEARVKVLEADISRGGSDVSLERVRNLEAQNADLRARLEYATKRTRELVARVRFVRQQQTKASSSGSLV